MARRVDSPMGMTRNAADIAVSAARPKRNRAQISYAESDPSDLDWTPEDSDIETVPTKKRAKKVAKSKPLAKNKIFEFMKLPAELRNKIYEECLKDGDAMYLISNQYMFRRVASRTSERECRAVSNGLSASHETWLEQKEAEKAGRNVPARKQLVPNILAVSKTIYQEAVNVLYRQPIVVSDCRVLLDFASMMTPNAASMVRDITIKSWSFGRNRQGKNFPAMVILARSGFVNLDRLNIEWVDTGYYSARRWGVAAEPGQLGHRPARKFYRDCYVWLEAVGKTKGEMSDAADVLHLEDANFNYGTSNLPKNEATQIIEMRRAAFTKELKSYMRDN